MWTSEPIGNTEFDVVLVAPSLSILGGQAVQADRYSLLAGRSRGRGLAAARQP